MRRFLGFCKSASRAGWGPKLGTATPPVAANVSGLEELAPPHELVITPRAFQGNDAGGVIGVGRSEHGATLRREDASGDALPGAGGGERAMPRVSGARAPERGRWKACSGVAWRSGNTGCTSKDLIAEFKNVLFNTGRELLATAEEVADRLLGSELL